VDLTPELEAWLEPVADTATPDQLEIITEGVSAIAFRYPEEDLADDRETALSGAVQVIIGDDTLEALGAAWRAKRAAELTAHAALTGGIIATHAMMPTLSEAKIADRTGMGRISVRKALGK
jgi:hypothetical protein